MSSVVERFLDWCPLVADIPDPDAPLYEHDEVKRAYMQGRINEEELESQMGDALEASGY